ncbi:MAG: hypothetical protein KG003_00630 [Bacteroidetes bacterium]|nr:hypothetical protein [Bacteroidota bacterium]
MRKIKNKLMLSCKEAAALIEKKQHFGLTLREKVDLTLHKMACSACRMYEKQNNALDKKLKEANDIDFAHSNLIDTQDFEQRILTELYTKTDKNL